MNNLQQNPPFDEMPSALSDVQRRTLSVTLSDHNSRNDSPVVIADDEAERTAVKRIVAMDRVHLPKLADYGFIEWDRKTEEVKRGPAFGAIRPPVELLDTHRDEMPTDRL